MLQFILNVKLCVMLLFHQPSVKLQQIITMLKQQFISDTCYNNLDIHNHQLQLFLIIVQLKISSKIILPKRDLNPGILCIIGFMINIYRKKLILYRKNHNSTLLIIILNIFQQYIIVKFAKNMFLIFLNGIASYVAS